MSILSLKKKVQNLNSSSVRPTAIKIVIGRDIFFKAAYGMFGLTPWKIALCFFLLGFSMLALFNIGLTIFNSPLLKLRGLFSYYSATIGDGFFLPLAVAASTAALNNMAELIDFSLKKGKDAELRKRVADLSVMLRGPLVGWLPVGLAIVVTIIVHVVWLLNTNTEPNWTMPDSLNFFGYWHAVFIFLCLWWFLSFLVRVLFFGRYLLGYSRSQLLTITSTRLWANINVLFAYLAGFAFLLYVDNYGTSLSWHTLLHSVITLTYIIVIITLLLTINIYFYKVVYRPFSILGSKIQNGELSFLAKRSWIAIVFGSLLVVALFGIVNFLEKSNGLTIPAVFSGILLPTLFTENYIANLFWNQSRVPDSVQFIGVPLIFFLASAGFLTATDLALQNTWDPTYSIIYWMGKLIPSYGMSTVVSILTLLLCVAVVWIASSTLRGKFITDHTPMHNIIKDFLQFWALLQLIIIPIGIFVFCARTTFENTLGTDITVIILRGFTAFVIIVVGFPLKLNYDHLRDLEKRKSEYSSFNAISNHILFQDLYIAFFVFSVLGWLWGAYYELIPLN
jgi:hypothetical protein